ncbi:Crossover junction endodeoxyribonuclease RuvC [Phycisphaerae bacterium RAS1]|nr:Crossover junction endodeoxyribonuclease RuvC [Phycisphaerae bacterium RAS1]
MSTPAEGFAVSRRSGDAAPLLLGIDPGLQRTGYAILSAGSRLDDAVLVEAGVIRLTPRTPLEERLVELEKSLAAVIEAHHPAILTCEQLYAHYKHPRTAILMGHARGVILATAARMGVRVLSVAATNVKKVLTGNGHASKRQMQRCVASTLRLARLPEPHDVADAIAIGLCGLRMSEAARIG